MVRALHFGEGAEGDDLQDRQARRGVDLRRDQDDVQEDGGAEQDARPLSDVRDRHGSYREPGAGSREPRLSCSSGSRLPVRLPD